MANKKELEKIKNDEVLQQFFKDNSYSTEMIVAFLLIRKNQRQKVIDEYTNNNVGHTRKQDPHIQNLIEQYTSILLTTDNLPGYIPIGFGLFEKRILKNDLRTIKYKRDFVTNKLVMLGDQESIFNILFEHE